MLLCRDRNIALGGLCGETRTTQEIGVLISRLDEIESLHREAGNVELG